jgi:DNA N-6-adenine-methyltransferase (Dam).
MSEHEPCVGASDDWYTPKFIFDALGLQFDLDPCSPGADHWVPANNVITEAVDGLSASWDGLVWMNPPFAGRNGQVPWLEKFIKHGNGIALVAARTSAGWFHNLVPRCDGLLFPKGKTKFVRPDGTVGGSPGTGVVLLAMGSQSCDALKNSGLGIYLSLGKEQANEQ